MHQVATLQHFVSGVRTDQRCPWPASHLGRKGDLVRSISLESALHLDQYVAFTSPFLRGGKESLSPSICDFCAAFEHSDLGPTLHLAHFEQQIGSISDVR